MAEIFTDDDAEILASITKGNPTTPAQAKIDAENAAIVDSMASGAAKGAARAANTISTESTNLGPGGASQYDVGYTSGKGDLNRYRGRQQSAWDQFANRSATVVPNIAYGVIELAGHILNTPDNIYGWATGGKSLDGGDNTFSNSISDWAAKQSEKDSLFGLGEFKNYAKDPSNSMDFSDSSFYINAGFDLFESISEFMITGMGVAKVAGMASKGIGALTKSLINTDMLGAGIKMSEKAAGVSSRIFNSAATSESVAALNASQVFKSVQAEMLQTKKPDGTYFTEEEARKFGSEAAASTFGTTLITSTALNYTSLAPFARKSMMKTGINPKGKTISQYEKMLEEVLADKAKLEAGKKTAAWYAGILRESGFEGLEEVTENVASDIGTRQAEQSAGLNPDFINIASAENALAFALGAIGGGFVKGYQVGLPAIERRMGKSDVDNSYEEFVQAQLNVTRKHRAFMNKIQDLNAIDMRGKSAEEINSHTVDMADAEMGMIANAMSNGIEDGTVRIMEQEIKNSLELDDVAAQAQGVDKDRLRLLDSTIKKHKKFAENIAAISSKPGKMQKATLNASIMKDLYSHKTEALRGQLNEILTSYIGPEAENAMAVNRLLSLEAIEESKLTSEQKKEMAMLDDHVNQLSEAEIIAAKNSDIINLNTVINEMQSNLQDVSEDFNKLNNSDTAEDHYDSIEAKFQAEEDSIALSIAADNRVKAAQSVIEKSDSVPEIESAIKLAKDVLSSKNLSEVEKEGLRERIDMMETMANEKVKKLRNDNKKKNRLDKASAQDVAIATKLNKGEELTPEEITYNQANTDKVRKVASDLKALAKEDNVEVNPPPPGDQEGVSPSMDDTTSMETQAETVVVPEDLSTVTDEELFGTVTETENESAAGDKVSSERPTTDDASPNKNPNPTAEQENEVNPPASVDADVQSADTILPDEEISTFQKQIRYHKFYDTVGGKKVEVKDPKKKRVKAEELLNKQIADQAAGRGHAGFQKIRIALISDQIRRYDTGLQRDIFIPKLDMNRNFEPNELKSLDNDIWVPVDQIFEAKDGFLLINTTDVLPGQEVEIVNEGKWSYASGTDTNLLVYRIINGKRATKPLAELPYQYVEEGSLTDKIRKEFESGKRTSPVRVYISGKNYGDLITESKPNGDRAENPISSAITSDLPMTFGYINEDGQYDLGKGFNPGRYTNPIHRQAVTEFHQSFVKPTTRTLGLDGGQGRASGTQFILTIAPNGKIVPVYMDAKTLAQQDVEYLMGKGESEGQVRNLYDILSEGRTEGEKVSSTGIVNLKKLMIMGSTTDNDISTYIQEASDNKKIFATPDAIVFRSDAITASNPRIPAGSWVRVTYNVPGSEFHPLNDMLNGKDFKYQVFGGESSEMLPGETTNWHDAKGETSQSLRSELNDIVAASKYNVSKDFLNDSGNFVDAYNNPTGMPYNEYVEKTGQFSTDVTGNKQKFINSSIKLRLVNTKSRTNSLTHEIQPTAAQNKAIDNAAERTVIAVSTAAEPSADLDEAAKRKVDNITKARRKNNDYTYLRDPDLDRGMASMSQPEVDWLLDAIGPNRLQMVKGVDRVLTIGGRKALGYFNNGMITLASEAEMGTGYHEAFHFVFHMALDGSQRAQILRQGRRRYGKLGEVEMEEALAEDFRAFMLERDKAPRPNAIQKFFKNLVSYISNIIGMNPNRRAVNKTTDLVGFYEQIATREWKSVYSEQFGVNLEPTVERFKLIEGFERSEQADIITDAASELVNMAKEEANDYETFADVISNRKRLKNLIKELRVNMSNLVLRTNKQADTLADVDRDLTAEEDSLLLNNYFAGKALQSWSLTDEQKTDINPVASFEIELLKSLNRYGFQVSVETTFVEQDPLKPIDPANENSIKIEKNTDSIEDLHADDVDIEDQQAHMYNMDVTLKDTKKTLSAELRRRLSMLPKYKTDEKGNLIKRSDGTYETELNMFGNPLMHNFNTAYSNIKSILADTPIQDLYATIEEEANVNPLFAAIYYNMQQEISKSSTADKHWDGFISEFMSAFNNSTYDLVTIKSGAIDKRGPQLIFVDRATIYRRINEKWEQAAQSKGLVDIEYLPNQSAWASIQIDYKAELDQLGFQPGHDEKGRGAFDNKAMAIAKKYLAKTGLDINPKALPDVFKRAGSSWDNVLRGKNRPSIEAIIARGARGKETPFGKDVLLNMFSKPQGKFDNDVNSGTAFANGKQVHTVNMESFISNVLNNIKSDYKNGKEGFMNMLSKDQFYNPDPNKPHLQNKLLEHWSNPDNLNNAKFIQFFDFKDGKEGREYINTNFNDSILQKIIGASSSRDTAYFSLGTLSDKLKNIAIQVPTATNLTSATENLKDAYIRTVYQELTRIKKVRNSKEFAKRYKHPNKDKFVYLPELNGEEFAPLLSQVTKGDMSLKEFNEFFEAKIIPTIEAKIDNDMKAEMDRLAYQGILEYGEDGGYKLTDDTKKHLSTNDKAGLQVIQKFLIEDRMWKMEMSKVFMGDMGKYKGFWDYFKRMYQLVTPGRKAYVNNELENASHKTTMNRLIIASPHSTFNSEALGTIAEGILSDEKLANKAKKEIDSLIESEKNGKALSNKQVENYIAKIAKRGKDGPKVANAVFIAYSYRNNNRGDSASFISIAFFKDQKKGLGEWKPEYDWIYDNVWAAAVTVEEATKGMTPEERSYYKAKDTKLTADILKPFYYGPRMEKIIDPETGNEMDNLLYEQFKDSMAPILPIWGKKISGFDWMIKQFDRGVDVISTDDTVKQGEFNPNQLGDSNELVDAGLRKGIPTSYLRYPQVPAKIKDAALAGTQLQKIIMSNLNPSAKYNIDGGLSAKQLSDKYHNAFAKKIKNSYDKVLDSLGIENESELYSLDDMNGDRKIKFLVNLRSLVEESVISQGKSESLVDALKIIKTAENNYDYELGMSFGPYSRSFQNMIMSIVRSNVLRQELPGGSMVNMADLSITEDDQLKFIRYENGEVLPAEIAMPHVHAEKIGVGWGILTADGKPTLDEKGNVLYENLTAEQTEALKTVIYRIPTQMKSSALPTIVKRILPDSDGAKMMIPGEMTTQAGLDFDFDKSFMIFKTFGEDTNPDGVEVDQMNNNQLDNTIFDTHWAVLTNQTHFEELVTPISSRAHESMLESMEVDQDSSMNDTDPFNPVTNIEMEGLAKYSHIMRGTFSKFASGHNVMTNLVIALGEDGNIDDYISTTVPVNIASGKKGYSYNEFGKQRDSDGKYISENHSENLNSALDSQNNPILGRLNTSVFNSMATGYMLDLGVPDRVVKKFMNSRVLKNLSHIYFQKGGVPYVLNDAIEQLVKEMNLGSYYAIQKDANKNVELTEDSLSDQSVITEVQILSDFVKYQRAGQDLSKLNDMLSPETQKISDAAGLREWMSKSRVLANGVLRVNPDLFSLEKTPLKKIGAFHQYGMNLSKSLMNGLFPYFTNYYDSTINKIVEAQNISYTLNWKTADQLHSAIDMLSLSKAAMQQDSNVINMASAGFSDRISLYKDQGKDTITDRYDYIIKKYPKILDNKFIAVLGKDRYNNRNETQLLTFPNASDNNDQQAIMGDFEGMLASPNDDIRQFARDLTAYTIATSGFSNNSFSFIMSIPVSFWTNSGIAPLMKLAKKNSKGYGSEEMESMEAIARSIGRESNIVPSFEIKESMIRKKKDGKISHIVLPLGNSILNATNIDSSPRFIKRYDSEAKKHVLYKRRDNIRGSDTGLAYAEISFFGEANRSHEMFNPYILTENSESKVPDNAVRNIAEDAQTRNEIASLDNIPVDLKGIEEQDSGMYTKAEMEEMYYEDFLNNTLDPEDGTMNIMPALTGTTITKKFSDELNKRLDEFLANNNIKVEIVDSLKDRFGIDAAGAADAINQAIYLAKGNEGRLAKPEEVSHIYIESTLDSRQTQRMLKEVEGTEEYKQVQQDYKDIYKGDDNKMRREAAAKILAKALVEPDAYKKANRNGLQRAIDAFMNMIKRLFGKADVFNMATMDIIKGSVLTGKASSDTVMFNLAGEDNLSEEEVVRQYRLLAADEEAYEQKVMENFVKSANQTMKGEEDISMDQVLAFLKSDEKASAKVNEAMTEIKDNLDAKIYRLKLKAKSKNNIGDVEGLEKLRSEINNVNDSVAMIAYIQDINDRINKMKNLFKSRGQNITNEDLMEMDQELKSYNNINYVASQLGKLEGGNVLSKVKENISNIMTQKGFLEEEISERSNTITSALLSEMTTENLTADQIAEQMRKSPKDVSFMSKWMRPGMDSEDLLVRMTSKLINDAKNEANKEFYDMVNSGPESLHRIVRAYALDAEKRGVKVSSMEELNKDFIIETNGKLYLINKDIGKEKYDKLLKLDPLDPRRMYYDKLVDMYIGSQKRVAKITGKAPFGYELPHIRKSKRERTAKGAAKEFLQNFTVRVDDEVDGYIGEGTVRTDESNEVIKDSPLFYQGKMEVDEISRDIAATIASSTHNLLQYDHLNAQKANLWAIQKAANERKVKKSKSGTLYKAANSLLTKVGAKDMFKTEEANSAHQVNMIIDQQLYGQTRKDAGGFNLFGKYIPWNKVSDLVKKFTSSKIMMFNFNIAASNFFTGESMMIQEAIGGNYFTLSDYKKGGKIASQQYGGLMQDIYGTGVSNKLSGMLQFMNLENDFKLAHKKFGQLSSSKGRALNVAASSGRMFQEVSQAYVMAHTVAATSQNIKVQDISGDYHSLWDVLEIKDGKMTMKKGMTYRGKPLEDQMNNLRERMIFIHESMHGVYNKLDAPAFNANIFGQQMLMMRGWLYSQMTRRTDLTRYNERLGGFTEGNFVSTVRLINDSFKTLKVTDAFTSLFYTSQKAEALLLTEEEQTKYKKDTAENKFVKDDLVKMRKGNIRKTRAELGMVLALMILNAFLWDDDDEETQGEAFSRYHLLRLQRELFFYNPSELLEIVKNPTINANLIKDGLDILWPFDDFDVIESGPHKGKIKLLRTIEKQIPGWNQYAAWNDLSRKADAIEQGFR